VISVFLCANFHYFAGDQKKAVRTLHMIFLAKVGQSSHIEREKKTELTIFKQLVPTCSQKK
jgi:hypothetical protein